MIRYTIVFIFALLIVILLLCSWASLRSNKPIGKSICLLCLVLIPPDLGNMLIIGTTTKSVALVGCYIYYIGMDLIMYALIRFTNEYCAVQNNKEKKKRIIPIWINYVLAVDVIQILISIVTGHAFILQEVESYGRPYFLMKPLWGPTAHILICYAVVAIVVIVFLIRSMKASLLYKERYMVILISMIIGALWQTYYLISRTPIDRSMLGFGVIGLLIFYFSIYYRPLRLLDKMLADIVSDSNEAVVLYGPEDRCIWANNPARKLTGISHDDFEEVSNTLISLFGDIRKFPEEKETEITLGALGNEQYYMVTHGKFFDRNNRPVGSYVRVRDITEEKHRIEMEMYAANHDALTGVYNKEYTFKVISDRLKQHALKDYYVACIYICDFKMFNDVFGREFGDAALVQISDWMRSYSDKSCVYGRIAGDAFGSCLPMQAFSQEIVERDLSRFKVRLGDIEQHLVIHVGFCEIEEDDTDVAVLFDRAMSALDSIRDDYKRHVAFFDKKIREKMLWNQKISAQLDVAIEENQIVPYLQPIADKSGKIVGAEALARWIHPEYGFMSPGNFIPLFEENGMITDLDKHIWKSACELLSHWEEKFPGIFISINVSPKDFYMTDVLSEIMSYVMKYDIDPHNLRIEVTESSMMRDTDDKMRILDEFRKQGFIVEMDDFGSGYSSLNMLKDMPVDVLKIDMNFLGKSNDQEKSDIIVKNVIRLSEDLHIVSLAEGVETVEQFDRLGELGCYLFQGYYFSKPIPVADFEAMLEKK